MGRYLHKGLLKVILSLAMLGLVLAFVDLQSLKTTLHGIPWQVAILAVAGYSLTMCISALKWWLLTRAGGIRVPYSMAVRAVFAGMFANCFGVGTVTGDVLRGALLTQGRGQRTEAIVSVFADRALGLAVLSLIGVIATATVTGHHMEASFVYILCAVSALIVIGWFIGPFLVRLAFPRGNALRDKVEQVLDVFARDPVAIVLVCLVAAVFHLAQITLQWQIACWIGIDVSFASMIVTIPFVNILSTLPISWNGLGIREHAYLVLLAEVFSREQAVAVGAVWLLGMTMSGLLGGALAILTGDIRLFRRQEKEA